MKQQTEVDIRTEEEKLIDMWEARLREDGLQLIEHQYKETCYIHGERHGGKRVYPLDELDGYNEELAYYDTYDIEETRISFSTLLSQIMVSKLPKPVRELGEKKLSQEENWTRANGQQLRRYLSFLTYERLESRARKDIHDRSLF